MIIIDDFLDDFKSFRKYCDGLDYNGETNPADGVFYPGVTVDIPMQVQGEVISKISSVMGYPIEPKVLFLRLSKKDVPVPHQAHTDSVMGQYSFMLYLNRQKDSKGGTAIIEHESGLRLNPINKKEEDVAKEDMNKPEKWHVVKKCDMRENRACIFDADLFHRAEPIGGFGDNPKNGRLVMTCFYD